MKAANEIKRVGNRARVLSVCRAPYNNEARFGLQNNILSRPLVIYTIITKIPQREGQQICAVAQSEPSSYLHNQVNSSWGPNLFVTENCS